MGGKQSKSPRYSHSSSFNQRSPTEGSSPYSFSSSNHGQTSKKTRERYTKIDDNYNTLDEVTKALAQAGLESSNLIVGIDFTKSNEWTGAISFGRKSLHHLGDAPNPYEQAISIIGRTLSAFDEDNLIPCYGFGDATTHDQDVFSFYPGDRPCNGFEESLARYRELVPQLRLAGPTSFAPIIETAIGIVDNSGGQYHVLLIIADGQVTRSSATEDSQLSKQEQDTVNAIVRASDYPLSIVVVGVGDGPWEMMKEFDDNIPARAFDNFQFVNFTDIMARNIPTFKKETEFALAALMEIPSQYKATLELQLLGTRRGTGGRTPRPPPIKNYSTSNYSTSKSNSFNLGGDFHTNASAFTSKSKSFNQGGNFHTSTSAPTSDDIQLNDNQVCPVCFVNSKNLAFGCGHQTCDACAKDLTLCPICRYQITSRLRLF